MKIRVENRQSLLDICIQEFGSLDQLIELALVNKLSITEDLYPGQILTIPEVSKNEIIVNYYRINKIKPATALVGIYQTNYSVSEYVESNYWE